MTFRVSLIVLACGLAFGQTPQSKPAFEVASIKPAPPSPMNQMRIMMQVDGGMLRYSNVSLREVLRTAFRVKDFQIQGPDWMGNARFDVSAKLPEGSSEKDVPEMLQTLLAERFKLAVHRETRDHAQLALVAAKSGAKLKPSEAPAAAPEGAAPRQGPPRGNMMMHMDNSGMHFSATGATMAGLAEALSRFVDRPVVDSTGIEGKYDFDLTFSPENMRGLRRMGPPGESDRAPGEPPAEQAGSVYDAVAKYGLKLDPRKGPLETIIIDRLEKEPTEN